MAKKPKKRFACLLSEGTLADIQALADKWECSQSEAIAKSVEQAIRLFQSIGNLAVRHGTPDFGAGLGGYVNPPTSELPPPGAIILDESVPVDRAILMHPHPVTGEPVVDHVFVDAVSERGKGKVSSEQEREVVREIESGFRRPIREKGAKR